ncbi:MAG: GGDEF domain-containing protein [Candidatus Izemoplasma sp.]|nr:GGDEF domain-containing protein [Candidatus Izemoplasma sp.]
MRTRVYLREKDQFKTAKIHDILDVPEEDITEKWQKTLDLLVKIAKVKAGLIMKITPENMKVFLKSQNKENPYHEDGKDHLGQGLYCETVIGDNRQLHIDNALKDKNWKDNPDVKLDMISYYGLPIRYPDGSYFGTICILDNTKITMDDYVAEWILLSRDIIEKDLVIMTQYQTLKHQVNHDFLTELSNRKRLYEFLNIVERDCKRDLYHYGIAMIDIRHFKQINDQYGHDTGDKVLKRVAQVMQKRVRQNDLLARFGGDEFVLVAKDIIETNFSKLLDSLEKTIQKDSVLMDYNISISIGYAMSYDLDCDYANLLAKADERMYKNRE